MEPLATLAAGTIAKLAFDEFVKAGAGEAAKRSVSGAIELVKNLQGQIKAKFAGNDRMEAALAEVEQQGSEAALQKVSKYLDLEMDEDKTFATEIRQMAQQIINIQNQNTTTLNQQNLNYGRDQNIINQPQGDIRITVRLVSNTSKRQRLSAFETIRKTLLPILVSARLSN